MSTAWLAETLGVSALSRQHIDGPTADRLIWEEATAGSQAIADLVAAHPEWPAFPNLLQDVFQTFFKADPHLRDAALVDPAAQGNRPYVEQLLQEPATQETRTQTRFDELAAAVATLAAGQKLAEQIRQNPDLDQAARDNIPVPAPHQGALAKALRRAAQAGRDEAADVQAQLMAWGLDGPALQTVPMAERLQLVEQLRTPRFRQMAQVIGRLRNLARARQGSALRHQRDELYRIRLGADLPFVLPQELGQLGDAVRQWDFGRRLVERQLLQYDMKPQGKKTQGPLLAAIDASGSMDGDRLTWAIAIGLALADTARRQRRSAGLVVFNHTIQATYLWPRGHVPPADLLAVAQIGAGGGTDFDAPLTWALDQIDQAPAFHRADIVLITDGECQLDDAVRTRLDHARRRGVQLFSLLIGGTPAELARWSDRIWTVTAPDDHAAGELFAELVPGA